MCAWARGLLILVAWVACAVMAPASAQELTLRWLTPAGQVIDQKTLTLAQIDGLKQSTIVTHTPWTEGSQTFTGPSLTVLAGLAGSAGAPPTEAKVIALNDYSATIPATDWTKLGAILSTRHNGQLMRVRDKGPFWVMYPIDTDPALAHQFYQSRMVWQVKSIDFLTQ